MFDQIFAVAMQLVSYYAEPERAATIAQAVALEAPSRVVGLATLVVWEGESQFAEDIHSGAKKGDHGLANCMGQLHASRWIPRALWATLAGTDLDATRRCADATGLVLARFRRWCGGWPGAFSAYATGRGCTVIPLGQRRADRLMGLLSR